MSNAPLPEALLRLEVEGLIKLYPKKGALVLPVSAQEIADVVETRLLVEEHAARKAVPAPAGLIERLEELLARQKKQAAAGDLAGAARRAFALHDRPLDGCYVITRYGWLDLDTGRSRTWKRLRI